MISSVGIASGQMGDNDKVLDKIDAVNYPTGLIF